MTSIGAEAAYRGYRHQALYTLYRILTDDSAQHLVFQPEGQEDLAIYDNTNHLREAVQIKSHTSPLTLSDFSPSNHRGYFRRTIDLLGARAEVTAKIASFGSFGPEMLQAWRNDGSDRLNIIQKLTESGFTPEEASQLIASISLEEVTEADLRERVFAVLRDSLVGGNPEGAFDLLTYWLYQAAEQRQQITYDILIEQISSVGRYLAERETHHQEWYRTITPIEDRTISSEEQGQYALDFYKGIAAHYDHILADVDIVRGKWLERIHEQFQESNVVIVHGASGQGKSSLAFRYLHDFVPQQWRFMVQAIEDRQHALNIARSLAGHADSVGAPMMIYLDVSFRDVGWIDLIRELAKHRNLQILVTIREEDWRRVFVPSSELQFEEVELLLDAEEAETLYSQLTSRKVSEQFLSFDEAWRRFGEGGPLLEFVHLITQNQSLRDRLQQQIINLEDRVRRNELTPDELQLLRLVAVASSYEARIDLPRLIDYLGLPTPRRTLELFEQEYLVRRSQDGSWIDGLHPIRSTILVELLTDDVLSPWIDYARQCLPLILEGDLEIFLLYAFSRQSETAEQLLEALLQIPVDSWTGFAGIANALLWLGIRHYVNDNQSLINEAANEFGPSGWWLALDFDIASVSTESTVDWWENLSVFTEETKAVIRDIRARQTPKQTAFRYLIQWLNDVSAPSLKPATLSDWLGLAQITFWKGYLQIINSVTLDLKDIDINEALADLPLDYLGDVVLGLAYGWDQFEVWFSGARESVIERFQHETNTVTIEDDGDAIRAHFIIDLSLHDDQLVSNEVQIPDRNRFHSEAMRRVKLLRKLIPDRQRYGCQGYGHRLSMMPLPHDDTTKTGVPKEMLPPFWAVRVNSIFGNLGSYDSRLPSWREYVESIADFRRNVLESMKQLRRAIEIYFRRQNETELVRKYIDEELWQRCYLQSARPPLLPRVAVDEWGFTGDGQERVIEPGAVPKQLEYTLALWKHREFLKMLREFAQHLNAFYQQSIHTLHANPYLGRKRSVGRDEIERILSEHGIRTDQVHLTVVNFADVIKELATFQTEFREKLANLIDLATLSNLERSESSVFKQMWNMWFQFAFSPTRNWQNAVQESDKRSKNEVSRVKQQLRRGLRQLSQQGIGGRIESDNIVWDGEPALWIVIDVNSPMEIYPAVEAVLQLITEAIHSEEFHDLKRYVIEFEWSKVLLVPLVRGRSIDQNAWQIQTGVLTVGHNQPDDAWWRFVPQPIPQDAWVNLGLQNWEHDRISVANAFRASLATLMMILSHICDFEDLPDTSGVGSDVLTSYIAEKSSIITETFQHAIDTASEMLGFFNSLPEEEKAQCLELQQAIRILSESWESIVPYPDFDGEVRLDFEGIKDWAERLTKAQPSIEELRLHWITDILQRLEQTPTN